MLGICLIIFGIIIISASLIMYSLLVGYARGMNTTGCQQYCSIQWNDFVGSDSLIFYMPALFGLIIMIIGIYIYHNHKRRDKS